MALFFKTFRHNTLADSLGIPFFPLSKNELKHQAKYEDDVFSLSENSSLKEAMKGLDKFAKMDLNRKNRQSVLLAPPQEILPDEMKDTERRSNQSKTRADIRKSLSTSFSSFRKSARPPHFKRTTSDVDEVRQSLDLAKQDFHFDHKIFHRKVSGEMIANVKGKRNARSSLLIRKVSDPMVISTETRENLGKVHYQLAVLHGMGRFPEVVPENPDDDRTFDSPPHDVFSVLFHLAHAASLKCVAACLALGRVHAGLGTCVSNLLETIVSIDFDAAKSLLRRAMESPYPPSAPKAAAGCFLYQIYLDEHESDDLEAEKVTDTALMHLLEDILKLMAEAQHENTAADGHKQRNAASTSFMAGDRVEGNYFMEGTYYAGVVESVSEDGSEIVVKYDDDGSSENLTKENVTLIIPPNATQTALGGPLSDEEALGSENTDEKCMMEVYELRGELAELKEKAGEKETAAALYEKASNEAMNAGKMKKATEWSLKAAELMD
jgi:elongation factor 2 kinase